MRARRDLRPFVYAGFDFLYAAFFLVVAVLAPSRHLFEKLVLMGLPLTALAMGVAMFLRGPWGRTIALVGCGCLLGVELLLIVLLLLSAAFLSGVYGSFGSGAAALALVVVALSFELVALLPALQLGYLLTGAGRRAFDLAP
jgi:hypothetical protein